MSQRMRSHPRLSPLKIPPDSAFSSLVSIFFQNYCATFGFVLVFIISGVCHRVWQKSHLAVTSRKSPVSLIMFRQRLKDAVSSSVGRLFNLACGHRGFPHAFSQEKTASSQRASESNCLLEADGNIGRRINHFHSFLLQVCVEPFLRAAGNDPADHIPGEVDFEDPEGGIRMDFQDRIPRDHPLVDAVGNSKSRHGTTAPEPAFPE